MEGLPHARGGVSQPAPAVAVREGSSPRSWGCFQPRSIFRGQGAVFPTLVGVFLRYCCSGVLTKGLPHARGGVSIVQSLLSFAMESSPRSWGCFPPSAGALIVGMVFPTLVGVFLHPVCWRTALRGLPHARGGVSVHIQTGQHGCRSSPRSWGCFRWARKAGEGREVFPTLVGVFPCP